MIEWTRASSICARCKRTAGAQVSAKAKAKRQRDEEAAVVRQVEDVRQVPQGAPQEFSMPLPPDVKAKVATQTPVRPVVVHSNATTSTTTGSSCPGDEVLRSLVVANEQLVTSGYAKINLEDDAGDDASTYFRTLREVGEKLFDSIDIGRSLLAMGPSRSLVLPPLLPEAISCFRLTLREFRRCLST